MSASPFPNEKFTAASLPRICLQRPRVRHLFERAAEKRVLFVSAPAGYGKTISTRLWLSQEDIETVWIGLDDYDNTPSIFYKLFCTGIYSLQPDNEDMRKILRSPSFTLSPVEHAIRLLGEFVPDDRRYALVLDDMHFIMNKELLKSGLLVRKRLPFSFITVVLTRNEISENYTSALGEDHYEVLSAEELAFNSAEIREYFLAHGHQITPEEAEKVRDATEGWAMGVNALAISGQTEPGSHANKILSAYIKQQIWDKWDDSLRMFLMQTSAADEIPVPLCEKLTEQADSRAILEGLNQANAFIGRVSEDVYAYHHLFLEFLRTQAEEHRLDLLPLYKTAAEYYMDLGEYFVARRYAVRSGDFGIMLCVMNHLSQYRGASMDEFVQFSKIHAGETPPESLCEQAPFLYSTPLWENYLRGNAVRMEYYMDKLYTHLPVIARDIPQYLETALTLILLDHRVPLLELTTRYDKLTLNAKRYPRSPRATLTGEALFLHRSTRDYTDLADPALFEKVWRMLSAVYRENTELAKYLMKSGLLMEAGQMEEALAAAHEAKQLITEETSDELRFSVYSHISAVYYSLKSEAYSEMMAEAERFIEQNDFYGLRPNLLALKTRIALLNGDRNAAHLWLENYFVTENEELALYKFYQHATTARAYLVLGRLDEAKRYIYDLYQMAKDFRRPMDIAEAGVLRSILEWTEGKKADALDTLETVLRSLRPYGFIRIVSLEGAAILPILKRLDTRVKKEDYDGPLEARYLRRVILSTYEQAKRYKGTTVHITAKPVKLSKQQKKVLTLLARGYNYKEITEETGLTIHTVKSHISAAYGKLDAHTALEAAAKAREMELIE